MEQTLHPRRRIAIVGATSGIGLATAELLRARGHAVLAIGRDPAKLDALARSADSAAGTGSLVVGRADGGNHDALRALLQTHAPIDDLVIAASGGKGAGPFAGLALDELRAGFEQKFWVHLTTLQAALDGLAPDASITLITAVSARTAMPGTSGLAAINGALETMVPILARELAPRRVNAISPGIIDTPWWNGVPEDARGEIFAAYAASTPLGRVGAAPEVAHAIAFVVENRYVTGSVLEVAGGFQVV
jgi:NAD(P)-dependent dehydrogenase (short-subunit alcohol dehydrogenase family)